MLAKEATLGELSNPVPQSEVLIAISALPTLRSSMQFAVDLCAHLCLNGATAFILPVLDPGHRVFFRQRLTDIRNSVLFMPVIDKYSLNFESCALELYQTLRTSLLSGQPMVIPVLDSGLDAEIKNAQPIPQTEPVGEGSKRKTGGITDLADAKGTPAASPLSLSPRIIEILAQLKAKCATLRTDCDPKEAAHRTANLLNHLGVPLPARNASAGVPMSDLFTERFAGISSHRPNSGVLKILASITDPAECKELRLPSLYMAALGCVALTVPIRMLPRLTLLDISNNAIGNRGVTVLCKSVRYHPSLARLLLSNNDISIAGAAEIWQLCCDNTRIVQVDLEGNPIDSVVWERRLGTQLEGNRAEAASHDADTVASSGLVPRECPCTSSYPVQLRAVYDKGGGTVEIIATCGIKANEKIVFTVPSTQQVVAKVTAKLGPQADQQQQPHNQLLQHVRTFLTRGVTTKLITVLRLNGKWIKVILASGVTGAEQIVRLCLHCALARADCPEALRRAMTTGSSAVPVDFVLIHDSPEKDNFFVQIRVTFWKDRMVASSLAQIFREQIFKYCGNITDELLAVLDALSLEGITESATVKTLQDAESEQEKQANEFETGMKQGVLSDWTAFKGKDSAQNASADDK